MTATGGHGDGIMDVGGVRDVTSSWPPATVQYNNTLYSASLSRVSCVIYTFL